MTSMDVYGSTYLKSTILNTDPLRVHVILYYNPIVSLVSPLYI